MLRERNRLPVRSGWWEHQLQVAMANDDWPECRRRSDAVRRPASNGCLDIGLG